MCFTARGRKRWALHQASLRWLSNCFEVYLRNTDTITAQHKQALSDVHNNMAQMALAAAGMNVIESGNGTIDLQMDDLEDED